MVDNIATVVRELVVKGAIEVEEGLEKVVGELVVEGAVEVGEDHCSLQDFPKQWD